MHDCAVTKHATDAIPFHTTFFCSELSREDVLDLLAQHTMPTHISRSYYNPGTTPRSKTLQIMSSTMAYGGGPAFGARHGADAVVPPSALAHDELYRARNCHSMNSTPLIGFVLY